MSNLADLAARVRSLPQQHSDYAEPFRVERFSTNGLTWPDRTISCVVLITFFAMQVGVNPRASGACVLLGGFVRSLPSVGVVTVEVCLPASRP